MKRDDPRFDQACKNMASFMFGATWGNGYENLDELWDALPLSTQLDIKAFILEEHRGPKKRLCGTQ